MTDRVPVWFMRQAGRSLPEYRKLREGHSILELCRTPDLAAKVTLQPVRRYGVDAAILFSDIVVPLQAMGVDLDIEPGIGPVIASPIRDRAAVDRLGELEPVGYVLETIGILKRELDVPLIGFGGAPFTLASYLVEGGPSKDQARTRALMYSDPTAWHALMERLTVAMLAYLRSQVEAGADAIQLFDSWVGSLSPADYEAMVLPYVARILHGLEDLSVPRITFGVGTGELLGLMASSGADVVGVDWRVPLDEARRRTGERVALQGNLDPVVCLAGWEATRKQADEVLRRGGGRGHIFNLGHGVLPESDPAIYERLVEHVHAWKP
ncbi:MAG: uroporphyrinogen decarboxylase [Actinobacteria bacterium]|nr:uroporphyrinogen decarboxylase [Actinomycetota bacterium]